jgi:hypothetical protein
MIGSVSFNQKPFGRQTFGQHNIWMKFLCPGNTKGGSITVPLTSCLTGLDSSVLQIKTKFVSGHTADSKPVKQEVNGTVILPPLVFPAVSVGQMIIGQCSNNSPSSLSSDHLHCCFIIISF